MADNVPGYHQGKIIGIQGGAIMLADTDLVTGWTGWTNDTTGLAAITTHVIGTKSIQFDKVNGAANTIIGAIQKSIEPVSLVPLLLEGGYVAWCLWVSALTDIANTFLRLGTDASNYNEWLVDDGDMVAGTGAWQAHRVDICAPNGTAAGVGWDPTNIRWLCVGCTFDGEDDALADMLVDNIHAGRATPVISV